VDLQLIVGDGCRFISKSGRDLLAVGTEVNDWINANATHPRRVEAELWVSFVDDELQQRQSIEARNKAENPSIRETEKLLRRIARSRGRRTGWSADKTRKHAQEMVSLADKFLTTDADELLAYLTQRQSKN
jgi:hypothetical protein